MSSPKVILLGGVAGVFSGLFWILAGLSPEGPGLVLALVLGLGGLTGLYSQQAGQGGKLGLVGFTLGIIGTAVLLAILWRDSASDAQSMLIAVSGWVVLGIGLALLGIASLHAKNRWRGLPLGLGLLNIMISITIWLFIEIPSSRGEKLPWPGPFLPVFVELAILGLGWIIQGSMLASEAEAKVAQPPPASA